MFAAKGFLAQLVSDTTPNATVIKNLGNVVIPIFKAKAGAPTIATTSSGTTSGNYDTDLYWIAQYVDEPNFVGGGTCIASEGDTPIPGDVYSRALGRLHSIAPAAIVFKFDVAYYPGAYFRLINDSGYYIVTSNPIPAISGTVSTRCHKPDGTSYGSSIPGPTLHVPAYSTSMSLYAEFFIVQDMNADGTLPSSNTWFADGQARGGSSMASNTVHTKYTLRRNTTASAVALFNEFWGMVSNKPESEPDPYSDLPTGGDQPLPGGGAVGIPGFPGLTATSAGVIGLFCPSAAQMQLLADFMWTDFGGTGTTVEDILKEVVEALKRTISNPLDYIVGLNIIPSQGLSIGAAKSVRFGFVDSGVSMPILANQYFTVDCGSIAFNTVCGDTFLDYAPYAKFSIYLPYIGFKDVDPNDFVGHSIGVVYHGDCVTGGITAYITKDGSVMYQYSGCCALNVPLSADSWGETISGAISVATGIVAAAATGGAAGVGLAAAKGAASVAANPSLLSPQVNHSGAVSGGAGCMGVQYPFVIREAVNFHSTDGFNKESGYPAYYYKELSEVTGFTTVLDPHINNIPQATQGEMSEIISLLESGVIL